MIFDAIGGSASDPSPFRQDSLCLTAGTHMSGSTELRAVGETKHIRERTLPMLLGRKHLSNAALAICLALVSIPALAQQEIPRAASTPQTPINWAGPGHRNFAQQLVDEIAATLPSW